MLDPFYELEPLPPEEAPAPPRGRPLIAWGVIGVLVLLIILVQITGARTREADKEDRMGVLTMKMEGRYVVGLPASKGVTGPSAYSMALRLNTGPVPRRLCFLVLAGELAGPDEALREIDLLRERMTEQGIKPTPTQDLLLTDLEDLYTDYAGDRWTAPSLDPEERARLRRELDWFGELALAPPKGPDAEARDAVLRPARLTVTVLVSGLILALLLGLIGFCALVALVALLVMGKLRGGLVCGQTPGGVYAETFAVWLVLSIGLGVLVYLHPLFGRELLAQGLAALLSLVALAWPVLRGIPWRQVRQDIGLTGGRWGPLESAFGMVCYLTTLPLLFIGGILVMLLVAWQNSQGGPIAPADNFGPGKSPSHPIVLSIGKAGAWEWMQILFVASFVAPLVEEVMFRGVLYRHLREASVRFRAIGSVLFSGTLVSLVFAAIHPQGLAAIPALMALAYGFTLAREWRGSLIAPITAHAVHNGILTLFMFLMLGT